MPLNNPRTSTSDDEECLESQNAPSTSEIGKPAGARAAFDVWWADRGAGYEYSWLCGKDAWKKQIRAALEAAALSTEPGEAERWQPTHRHKKRGSTYRVIAEGRLQVDADLDNEKVVVYRGEDGQVWVRPTYEFNDGRFEALPAAPLPEGTHHGR